MTPKEKEALRDCIALSAMQSYLTTAEYANDPKTQRAVAISSYKMADMMLEARSK